MRPVNLATPAEQAAYRGQTKAQRHAAGVMNAGERAYGLLLATMRDYGVVRQFMFEGEKLRLGLRCFLTPDFRVVMPNGSVEWHEVKPRKSNGRFYAREDAMLKLRVAADRYREAKFYVVWPDGNGGWCKERIRSAEGQP